MTYTSCCLIPLNKRPGVHPIRIEVVRRIIGKVVMRIVKHDLKHAVDHSAMCRSRCWLLFIHFFADEDTKAMILVDASNALNCLNRQVTLLNRGAICLALLNILVKTTSNAPNTCAKPSELVRE